MQTVFKESLRKCIENSDVVVEVIQNNWNTLTESIIEWGHILQQHEKGKLNRCYTTT